MMKKILLLAVIVFAVVGVGFGQGGLRVEVVEMGWGTEYAGQGGRMVRPVHLKFAVANDSRAAVTVLGKELDGEFLAGLEPEAFDESSGRWEKYDGFAVVLFMEPKKVFLSAPRQMKDAKRELQPGEKVVLRMSSPGELPCGKKFRVKATVSEKGSAELTEISSETFTIQEICGEKHSAREIRE